MARECSCCKQDRKKATKGPRLLIELPRVLTQDKTLFKKPTATIFMCEHCDGEATLSAIKHADKL